MNNKPYLISTGNYESALLHVRKNKIKFNDFLWVPLYNELDRHNHLSGKSSYPVERLVGHFSRDEIKNLTHE